MSLPVHQVSSSFEKEPDIATDLGFAEIKSLAVNLIVTPSLILAMNRWYNNGVIFDDNSYATGMATQATV